MWSYNWVWPVLAVALVACGLVLTWRSLAGRALIGARGAAVLAACRSKPGLMVPLALGVAAVPWAVAVANLGSIGGV